jgi:phage tail-like protein
MAVSAQDIRQTYPLPVYNYRVEIAGDAIGFSEVSGLNIGHEVTTYKESATGGGGPGPRVLHMPGQPTSPNITLKKGIVRGQSVATLYRWIDSIKLNQVDKKDIFIRLCDETGAPVISWRVINAFPVKLDAPSFDSKSNDVAVESMELRADRVSIDEA